MAGLSGVHLVLLVVFGEGEQDHGEFLSVDLAIIIIVDSLQDRFLEVQKVLGVIILQITVGTILAIKLNFIGDLEV